jgi:hypothetical protein
MKPSGRVDTEMHVFLNSALAGGEQSASRLGRFIPGKNLLVPIGLELGWHQTRSRRYEYRKLFALPGNREGHPVAILLLLQFTLLYKH